MAIDLLRCPDAAKFLDVSEMTLQRWRARGTGPAWIRLSDNIIRYRTIDLEAYIQRKIQKGGL